MTRRADKILDMLVDLYPDAVCALEHQSPFELLIATILSAQCTDARVNIITRRLFAQASTPAAVLELGEEQLRQLIYGCGLHNNKAANIMAACHMLQEQHGGEVPRTREELEALPGVGRKTASVVLSTAFGQPAIAVDTHVFRVSKRLGLADGITPEKTEQQLMKTFPRNRWSHSHHLLIFHGRNLCMARRPLCEQCPLKGMCNYYQECQKNE